MAREKEPEAEARAGNQGNCLRCRRILPLSAFMRDATGDHTAWCQVCREELAKIWGVDADLIELVRALYVLEVAAQKEAEATAQARAHQGQAEEGAMKAIRDRIHRHHMIRHARIRTRVNDIVRNQREMFFVGIGMVPPETVVPSLGSDPASWASAGKLNRNGWFGDAGGWHGAGSGGAGRGWYITSRNRACRGCRGNGSNGSASAVVFGGERKTGRQHGSDDREKDEGQPE